MTPCQADPPLFDYQHEDEGRLAARARRKHAAALCGTCPVLEACRTQRDPGAAGVIAGQVWEAPTVVHEPRRLGRPVGAPPPHGTVARYVSVSARCRCDECRAAIAQYERARSARRRASR